MAKNLTVKRVLPGALFRDIANSKILQECPVFGLAVIKASMYCTRNSVVHGKAHLFSSHDILMFERNRDAIERASNMQSTARKYLQALGVEQQSYEFVLGCFDARLAEFVSKKVQSGRPQYDSFSQICASFISEIKVALGAIAGGAPLPFAQLPQPTSAGASTSSESRIVEFGTTGIVEDSSLKAKGFEVDVEVVGPDGTPHKIKEFTDTHIVLYNKDAKKKTRPSRFSRT